MKYKTLHIALAGDEPPSEFRLFTAGTVDTTKGEFTFDAKSAASVMADYKARGIDLMIDYDHASLATGCAPDPAQAGKAAGWFNLEVRNGELWAVNVRWTEPAADAMRRKEWRFMSPAFTTDSDGRVLTVMNCAITNLPATRRLQPLMAASSKGSTGMTLEELIKVAKALGLDMTASVEEVMAKLKGGADPDADTEDAPPPVGDGGADESTEPAAAGAAAPAPAEDPSKKEAMAASRVAMALTGKTDAGEAMAELARRSQVAVDLEAREAKLSQDRAALEGTERRSLVAQLVKLGVELPATAWGDEKGTVPCKRLADEPIAELRARVKVLAAAKPQPRVTPPAKPAGELGLTPEQLALCKETGCTPETFAALKNGQKARS